MARGGPALPLPHLRSKNLKTAAAMIKVARSQVGYREGSNNNNAYGRWYGMNHQPYCAIGISWCAAKSGCSKIIPKHAYTPSGAQWFKDRGQTVAHNKIKAGDIHYVYHSSMGRIAHVELVTYVNKTKGVYEVVGWNTSNGSSRNGDGVYKLVKRLDRINPKDVFGRPKYDPYEK